MLLKCSRLFPRLGKEIVRNERTHIAKAETKGLGSLSMEVMEKEDRYGAHNYHPLPVALCKGQGKAEEGGYDVGVVMMLDFSMTF